MTSYDENLYHHPATETPPDLYLLYEENPEILNWQNCFRSRDFSAVQWFLTWIFHQIATRNIKGATMHFMSQSVVNGEKIIGIRYRLGKGHSILLKIQVFMWKDADKINKH